MLGEVSPARPDVLSVIKRRRTSSTYLLDASSLDNSGSLFFDGLVSPHSLHSHVSFDSLWEKVEASFAGDMRKGLNSLVILGVWSVWKHRNDCFFNGAVPNVITVLSLAMDEARLCCLAGARGLTLLSFQGVG